MGKISIVIPIHWMDNWQHFLTRCLGSIEKQTFKDYEIILMKVDSMPITSNRVIESAKGEIIKILYMDDYLAHDDALRVIADNFTEDTQWLATGCLHQMGDGIPNTPHYPLWNDEMGKGANSIGSPSVIAIRNQGHLLFDENLSWLLDCDLYTRYYERYGPPKLVNDLNVVMGLGDHQMTNVLTKEQKESEFIYLQNKQ